MKNGQTAEDRFLEIINKVAETSMKNSGEGNDEAVKYVSGIDTRFKRYFEKGWVSLATPVISAFGAKDNLPIS